MDFLGETGLSRLWGHIILKLSNKVDKVNGMGLSSNDYTMEEKEKLAGIAAITPISKGGTGATTAETALTNLGITATASELNKLDGVTTLVSDVSLSGSTLSVSDVSGNVTDLALPTGGSSTAGAIREFDSGAISTTSYTYAGINSMFYLLSLQATVDGVVYNFTTNVSYRSIRYLGGNSTTCTYRWHVPVCLGSSTTLGSIFLEAKLIRSGANKGITFSIQETTGYVNLPKITYVEGFY